jgi:manganese/zinc/iron transport system ATP- binding protein
MSSAKLVAESGEILDVASKDAPLTVRGLTVSYGNKPAVFSVDA